MKTLRECKSHVRQEVSLLAVAAHFTEGTVVPEVCLVMT